MKYYIYIKRYEGCVRIFGETKENIDHIKSGKSEIARFALVSYPVSYDEVDFRARFSEMLFKVYDYIVKKETEEDGLVALRTKSEATIIDVVNGMPDRVRERILQ